MTRDNESLVLRNPASPSDWDTYFDLRRRIPCVLPGASLAAASAIRLKKRLFTSCFSILTAKRLPVWQIKPQQS